MNELITTLESLKTANKKRVVVIGDVMLDKYLFGECNRISPEAPVPIFNIINECDMLGGAGNVFKNLIDLNIQAELITVVGDDAEGLVVEKLIKEKNNSNSSVFVQSERKTTVKTRLIASNQQLIRIDNETTSDILVSIEDKIIDKLYSIINNIDLILISDYSKGLLTPELTKRIIQLANDKSVKTIVDPKGNNYKKYSKAYLIKPNLKEFEEIIGCKLTDTSQIKNYAIKFKTNFEIDNLIVTLGADGMYLSNNENIHFPTHNSEVYDVSGAGDTVLSALALALSHNYNLNIACQIANVAASNVVKKIGSVTTNINELIEEANKYHEFRVTN